MWNFDAIDNAARHLRETLQSGKRLTPWEETPKATKKKWFVLAEGTLKAALDAADKRQPSLSDRQYLEKIADQVIARNHTQAETPRQTSPVVGTESARSGVGASKVVCPALIDDVGGE